MRKYFASTFAKIGKINYECMDVKALSPSRELWLSADFQETGAPSTTFSKDLLYRIRLKPNKSLSP